MTPTKEIDKRMQLRAETGCPTPVMIKWFLVAQHHALSRLARSRSFLGHVSLCGLRPPWQKTACGTVGPSADLIDICAGFSEPKVSFKKGNWPLLRS